MDNLPLSFFRFIFPIFLPSITLGFRVPHSPVFSLLLPPYHSCITCFPPIILFFHSHVCSFVFIPFYSSLCYSFYQPQSYSFLSISILFFFIHLCILTLSFSGLFILFFFYFSSLSRFSFSF